MSVHPCEDSTHQSLVNDGSQRRTVQNDSLVGPPLVGHVLQFGEGQVLGLLQIKPRLSKENRMCHALYFLRSQKAIQVEANVAGAQIKVCSCDVRLKTFGWVHFVIGKPFNLSEKLRWIHRTSTLPLHRKAQSRTFCYPFHGIITFFLFKIKKLHIQSRVDVKVCFISEIYEKIMQ